MQAAVRAVLQERDLRHVAPSCSHFCPNQANFECLLLWHYVAECSYFQVATNAGVMQHDAVNYVRKLEIRQDRDSAELVND